MTIVMFWAKSHVYFRGKRFIKTIYLLKKMPTILISFVFSKTSKIVLKFGRTPENMIQAIEYYF